MRNPVLLAAINAGKASALATRLLGRGGGTALPGLVAQVVYPSVLRALTSQLPDGSIVVTGTNGKTTTTRMLSSILEAAGKHPLHNRSGSNLERGLISTMVGAATPGGGLPDNLRVGLFEVDEAAAASVLPTVRPRVALFNNLFRDQLDRYGEIDTIYRKWQAALPALGPRSKIVLNADDPAIASLADTEGLRAGVFTFGIADSSYALERLPHAADSISCPRCNSRLDYSLILLGHLGHWHCPNCGLSRVRPDVAATKVRLNGTESSDLGMMTPAGPMQVTLKVPGLYNVYNGLAAISTALVLGISPQHIQEGLEKFTAAFGRIERVAIPGSDDKSLLMALVKNPVGFNEVLRMLFPLEGIRDQGSGVGEEAVLAGELTPTSDDISSTSSLRNTKYEIRTPKHLLIIINDLIADGRDVSWLWDVDFEVMATPAPSSSPLVARVYVSGIRAADMAVRLKYAGVDATLLTVEPSFEHALDAALRDLPPHETLYVLPTYTAMLAFRKHLHSRGWVAGQFWEQ